MYQTNVRKYIDIHMFWCYSDTITKQKTRPHHTNDVGASLIMDGSTYIQTNSLTRTVENLT